MIYTLVDVWITRVFFRIKSQIPLRYETILVKSLLTFVFNFEIRKSTRIEIRGILNVVHSRQSDALVFQIFLEGVLGNGQLVI